MITRRTIGYLATAVALAAASFAAAGPASAAVLLSGADRDCGDFATQQDAQEYFDAKGYSASNDPERLDSANGKGDGVACEGRPRRAPKVDRGDAETVDPVPDPVLKERFGAPDRSTVNAK